MTNYQKQSECSRKGQSAVEYMLLLAAVVCVVLISFNSLMPKVRSNTQSFYNKAATGIVGKPPPAYTP